VSDRQPGKQVGSKLYVHAQYVKGAVPDELLLNAVRAAGAKIIGFDCVRYDSRTGSLAFQFSSDFDTAEEPLVDRTVRVSPEGRVQESVGMGQIWHHKWMWVADDYAGFDVEASKRRSQLWKPHVSKEELRKIGYKKYWDSIRHRWEA
jgi:hypothetical protein